MTCSKSTITTAWTTQTVVWSASSLVLISGIVTCSFPSKHTVLFSCVVLLECFWAIESRQAGCIKGSQPSLKTLSCPLLTSQRQDCQLKESLCLKGKVRLAKCRAAINPGNKQRGYVKGKDCGLGSNQQVTYVKHL